MLVSIILDFFGQVLYSLIGLLPTGTGLPTAAWDAVLTIVATSYQWDYVFPVSTLWLIFTLTVSFFVFWLGFGGIFWVLGMIRGN